LAKNVASKLKTCAAVNGFINAFVAFVPVLNPVYHSSKGVSGLPAAPGKVYGLLKVTFGHRLYRRTC
jgi:hypothetical protein